MDITFLIKGLVIGFSIAAPVGPIGLLCIRRTLAQGQAAGFLSGLGAATADAFYGVIAGFGLSLVSGLLLRQQGWLSLAGGLFLCYLGLKTFNSRPSRVTDPAPAAVSGQGLLKAYVSTLFLTLTNPATILSFAAVFAGLGVTGRNPATATLLVLGVFTGSALWWLALSGGVGALRGRFAPGRLYWLNRISGLVLGAFGLAALLNYFYSV